MSFYPDKHPAEREWFAFDFVHLLAPTELILSAVVTSTVKQGHDPAAQGMILGNAWVSGTKVTQMVINGVDRCRYRLQCTVVTDSAPPQTLVLADDLMVRAERVGPA
jgi:hypothetical protein